MGGGWTDGSRWGWAEPELSVAVCGEMQRADKQSQMETWREVKEKRKEGSDRWTDKQRGGGVGPVLLVESSDQKPTELRACYSAAAIVGPVDKFFSLLR